jgi:hypothetical protein
MLIIFMRRKMSEHEIIELHTENHEETHNEIHNVINNGRQSATLQKPTNYSWVRFGVSTTISLGTCILASYFLISDQFQNTAITSFAVGIISTNMAYWMDPPKIKKNTPNL